MGHLQYVSGNKRRIRNRRAGREAPPEGKEGKKMLAQNFNEFVEIMTEAERKALNTEAGQELTEKLLQMKLKQNPNMTAEEWQQTKSEFMTFIFYMFVRETPEAMKELGQHVWNELQKA